jgi:Icc-related predicted phosphoesterase
MQTLDVTEALFSCQKILQNFSDSPSHQIFGHIHEALNIDKK